MFRGRKLFRNVVICIICLFAISFSSEFFTNDNDGTKNSGFNIRFKSDVKFDNSKKFSIIRPIKGLKNVTVKANKTEVILNKSKDNYIRVMAIVRGSSEVLRKIPNDFIRGYGDDEFIIEQRKIKKLHLNSKDITIEIYVPQKYEKEINVSGSVGDKGIKD